MLAMDVSISSTSTCLLPATFLCRLSSTLVHDLAASYGHLVLFFGFLFQQSSTALTFLHLQVSVSCTINSSFETMGVVLHIVSKLVFSYMQLERTFLVLLKRGPGHFSYWHHSKFESGKDLLLHNVVSVHNSHDISLSTPLSRLWGKPCTSSPTSLSPICSWNVHFSFAELRCPYIFPKRHYPFPACRETTLTPASYSSPFSGTMLQSERQVVTNPAVGHGAWLLFSGFFLSFVFFVLVGRFHLANSTGPHVLGCKLAVFTGAHTFSVSMQLTLMNLMYWIFFSPAIPFWPQFMFIIHKSQTRTLRPIFFMLHPTLFRCSFLLQISSQIHRVQDFASNFRKDTPYKSTSQSDTKSLPESKAQGTSSALPKRHCSILQTETILSLCFYFRFCLQLTFFLQLVFPWGWRNAAADVWFNMKYVALVTKYIYIYVHIYIYTYMYICIFINIFIHIHIYIHIYIYIHIHTHTHTHTNTHTHTYTHTYAHTHIHTDTYTHTYILFLLRTGGRLFTGIHFSQTFWGSTFLMRNEKHLLLMRFSHGTVLWVDLWNLGILPGVER